MVGLLQRCFSSLILAYELCESPRLLGVDPIVRYFPPSNGNGAAVDRIKPSTPYFNKNLIKMNAEFEDSDDDVCFGPITFKELRKASIVKKIIRERDSVAPQKTFLEALEEQAASSDELPSNTDANSAGCSAPCPSPVKDQELIAQDALVEEFSLEESHFSGCNLSNLNLSFESGVSAPVPAVTANVLSSSEDGLYTLAFISDMAKKLEVGERPATPAKSSGVPKPVYSPISPAETTQYLDAENAKESMEHSSAQWHDAETGGKDVEDLENNDKKRISDISLLSDETEIFDASSDDKDDTAELLNDTIERMDMLLSMGVDFLEAEEKQEEEKDKEEPQNNSKYFATPQPKAQIADILEEYAVPRSPIQSKPAPKKFFQTPAAFKTPQNAKIQPKDKSNSAGNSRVDLAKQVHVSTPFRVPKCNEARSADFKLKPGSNSKAKFPVDLQFNKVNSFGSRLPKPVRAFQNITSPVGQYIHGPVVAPKIANAKPSSSPRIVGKLFSGSNTPTKLTPSKSDMENLNPNTLPYINYDSSSSIKVVEHKEMQQKTLPNKIKKLLPSPGSVVIRHTGRVNIPETSDGRHEVSIMVSQDAFQLNL
ncbi:Hypothetical predicted protein [Cloeon dipterum]|uniref:Uncharacterized protein n=1 Tax=Cloeon dipterum TaxID=197152 RepID=A0A8S1DU38_9INSE|nr:Hypothetical predicted protein [Cloeon dipterum]